MTQRISNGCFEQRERASADSIKGVIPLSWNLPKPKAEPPYILYNTRSVRRMWNFPNSAEEWCTTEAPATKTKQVD